MAAGAGSVELLSQAAIKRESNPLAAPPPPPEARSVSGLQQWRLVTLKSARLLSRDLYNTACITLVPGLLLLGLSALSLLGETEKYDMALEVAGTMRDGSVAAAMSDRMDDPLGILDNRWQVGEVLFAQTVSSPANLASDLCTYVMNTNGFYSDAVSVMTANGGGAGQVMTASCGSGAGASTGTCGCATSGAYQQVFSSLSSLDAKISEQASDSISNPVAAAVVITQYDAASKTVAWNFRYNRTMVPNTVEGTNDFSFYSNAYWLRWSELLMLPLQRFVDSYFIKQFASPAQNPDNLDPHFQAFPFEDWEYNPAKFGFLGGTFQWVFGFCMIFTLSSMVQTIVDEKKRRIKEGMLMMGLHTWVFWLSWVTIYLMVYLFVGFTCTIACYCFIFRQSNFIIVWGFITTFLISVEALGLLIAALFSEPNSASITAVFAYLIGIFVPDALGGLSRAARIVFCVLLSPFSFYWGFSIFAQYEGASQPIDFTNIGDVSERGRQEPIYLYEFWLICLAVTAAFLISK